MSLEQLKSVFERSLGLPPGLDVTALEYRGVAQWDSIAHLHLASSIESTFSIMLETEDVIGMSSFGKAAEILAKYGVLLHA